jgi:glucose/arabinose dehydrogenase
MAPDHNAGRDSSGCAGRHAAWGGRPVGEFEVCSNSERGLLVVTVDPAFASDRFLYLFYTFRKNNAGCPTSPVERVSRFMLPDTNVIDPASELVLIDDALNFAGNYNGGEVKFGTGG